MLLASGLTRPGMRRGSLRTRCRTPLCYLGVVAAACRLLAGLAPHRLLPERGVARRVLAVARKALVVGMWLPRIIVVSNRAPHPVGRQLKRPRVAVIGEVRR